MLGRKQQASLGILRVREVAAYLGGWSTLRVMEEAAGELGSSWFEGKGGG